VEYPWSHVGYAEFLSLCRKESKSTSAEEGVDTLLSTADRSTTRLNRLEDDDHQS